MNAARPPGRAAFRFTETRRRRALFVKRERARLLTHQIFGCEVGTFHVARPAERSDRDLPVACCSAQDQTDVVWGIEEGRGGGRVKATGVP
jgi:hypothetical protein